jgi:hypothetical protein
VAFETVVGERENQNFFESPQVGPDVSPPALEIHHRVADQLAWAVIGHIAAAVGLVIVDAELAQAVFGDQQILVFSVAAEGDHVGMFDEEQSVLAVSILEVFDLLKLQIPGGAVI